MRAIDPPLNFRLLLSQWPPMPPNALFFIPQAIKSQVRGFFSFSLPCANATIAFLSQGNSQQTYSIGFSLDGKLLAAGIDDCVYVWNTANWTIDLCYRKDSSKILSVSWDRSGRLYFGCDKGWLTVVSFNDKVSLSFLDLNLSTISS